MSPGCRTEIIGIICQQQILASALREMLKVRSLTRFNKVAIKGAPQMAVDKEATVVAYRESTHTILSVTFPYYMCNLP